MDWISIGASALVGGIVGLVLDFPLRRLGVPGAVRVLLVVAMAAGIRQLGWPEVPVEVRMALLSDGQRQEILAFAHKDRLVGQLLDRHPEDEDRIIESILRAKADPRDPTSRLIVQQFLIDHLPEYALRTSDEAIVRLASATMGSVHALALKDPAACEAMIFGAGRTSPAVARLQDVMGPAAHHALSAVVRDAIHSPQPAPERSEFDTLVAGLRDSAEGDPRYHDPFEQDLPPQSGCRMLLSMYLFAHETLPKHQFALLLRASVGYALRGARENTI
jgi:hypothetical protein